MRGQVSWDLGYEFLVIRYIKMVISMGFTTQNVGYSDLLYKNGELVGF
jgi:hypothetical protein